MYFFINLVLWVCLIVTKLVTLKQEFLDKAMEKIKWSLDKLVSKGKISKEEGDSIFSRITPIVDLKLVCLNSILFSPLLYLKILV